MMTRYPEYVKLVDAGRTVGEMQAIADVLRREYAALDRSDPNYEHVVADAAYCQALADQKRRTEQETPS